MPGMKIYTLVFNPKNWMELSQELSQLDRFDAQWQAIERREQKTLKELKSIATVRSVGASTRIEGSNLSDKEVEILIENLDINKLTARDEAGSSGGIMRLLKPDRRIISGYSNSGKQYPASA